MPGKDKRKLYEVKEQEVNSDTSLQKVLTTSIKSAKSYCKTASIGYLNILAITHLGSVAIPANVVVEPIVGKLIEDAFDTVAKYIDPRDENTGRIEKVILDIYDDQCEEMSLKDFKSMFNKQLLKAINMAFNDKDRLKALREEAQKYKDRYFFDYRASVETKRLIDCLLNNKQSLESKITVLYAYIRFDPKTKNHEHGFCAILHEFLKVELAEVWQEHIKNDKGTSSISPAASSTFLSSSSSRESTSQASSTSSVTALSQCDTTSSSSSGISSTYSFKTTSSTEEQSSQGDLSTRLLSANSELKSHATSASVSTSVSPENSLLLSEQSDACRDQPKKETSRKKSKVGVVL